MRMLPGFALFVPFVLAAPLPAQQPEFAVLLERAAGAPPAAIESMRLLGDAQRREDWDAVERLLAERRASLVGMDDWVLLVAARAAAGKRNAGRADSLVAGLPASVRQQFGWDVRMQARRGDTAATRAFALEQVAQGGTAGARAAWVAASHGAEPAAPLLLQALRNGDVAVATAAAGALERRGVQSPNVAVEVARALVRGGRGAGFAERVLARTDLDEAARRQLGQALAAHFFATGEYDRAVRFYGELAESETTRAARGEARYQLARSYYRLGQQDRAHATFREIARLYDDLPVGGRAVFFRADVAHDAGRLAEAEPLYRRVAAGPSPADVRALAVHRLVGLAWDRGDRALVGRLSAEYRGALRSGADLQQLDYWHARSLEALGRADSARVLYTAVVRRDAMSYYGMQAADRLGRPWSLPPRAGWPDAPGPAVRGALARLDLLRAGGMDGERRAELARQAGHFERAGGQVRGLHARGLIERGDGGPAIRAGQAIGSTGGWSRESLELAFPIAHRDLILGAAREHGLAAQDIAALIRQESAFTVDARSRVGALGLMQLMPATAETVARQLGIDYRAAALTDAAYNIRLGSAHFSDLVRQNGGRLVDVLIAYNAGSHRLARWKQFPEYADAERFIERIPFQETRDYVKIILRNRRIYEALYPAAAAR